jgi:hypothetical protein
LPASGLQFQWFLNGSPVPLATDSLLASPEPGTYTVQVRNGAGCLSVSAPFLLTGLAGSMPSGLEIFPNPVWGGLLEVVSKEPMEEIRLLNMQGQVVMEQKEVGVYESQMKVLSLPAGVYQIQIRTQQNWIQKRLVVK